ncbi:MAG: hypothetical protein LBQ08_05100 [Holosporaceae bacterium]|jgi:hypothetical protein|nr:hypothetical protein [Holosporaceae bacterium]
MANFNSNIAAAIAQKNSIRTNNFRGSLICTTLTIAGLKDLAANDIISLMPIQWGASIKSIRWRVSATATALTGAISVGGINRSFYEIDGKGVAGSIIEISDATIVAASTDLSADKADLLAMDKSNKTVYELLLNTGAERDTFKPFKNDRYGMLYLKIGVVTTVDATAQVEIQYVDPSPSWSRMAMVSG